MNSAISAIIRHYRIFPDILKQTGLTGAFIILILFCIVGTIIMQGCYEQIPERHRNLKHPWMVWLIWVPLPFFSSYWIFRSTVGMSRSFKSAFEEVGDESVGNCALTSSFIFAWTAILVPAPVLDIILLPVLAITGIVWLSYMSNLRSRLRSIGIASRLPQPMGTSFPVGSLLPQPDQSLASVIATRARQGLANPYGEAAGLEKNGAQQKQGLSTGAWWLIVLILVLAAAIILIRMKNAQEREDQYNQRSIQYQYYR